MKKEQYLSSESDVLPFVRWMANHVQSASTLGHCYERHRLPRLEFANLADALRKYEWAFQYEGVDGRRYTGKTLSESGEVLGDLQDRLCRAVRTPGDGDRSAMEAAIEVVRWGGVAPHNERWLRANEHGLAQRLHAVKALLDTGEDAVRFDDDLRFNAGMTKVYSLLVPGFVIYDSRVAAALAWFVLRWMNEIGRDHIPELLRFPCMPAKEARNALRKKVRNPILDRLNGFPSMNNSAHRHIHWNLRASWVVGALTQVVGTEFFHVGGSTRKLEAALFMWGYDLS